MQPTRFGCSSLWRFAMICFLGAFATPVGALTATPNVEPTTTPTSCSGCTRLGYLSVSPPTLDPPMPAVGDLVTFTFSVSFALPGGFDCGGGGSCTFEDDGLLLDGDEPPTRSGDAVVVRRHVARAGVTVVQLRVTAMTEDQCYSPDPQFGCRTYFRFVPIEATSSPFDLQLAEANATTPTDAPTNTPTPTATITPSSTPTQTSCGVDTPLVDPVTSPTDQLQQTITGQARLTGRRSLGICGEGGCAGCVFGPPACTGSTFSVPVPLAPNQVNHLTVCAGDPCGPPVCTSLDRTGLPLVIVQVQQVTPAHTPTAATPTGTPTATITPPPTLTPTPTPLAVCAGDCDGTRTVNVATLTLLVNIALGNVDPSACAHGIPTGTGVDVSFIVQAVNNALAGCPANRHSLQ